MPFMCSQLPHMCVSVNVRHADPANPAWRASTEPGSGIIPPPCRWATVTSDHSIAMHCHGPGACVESWHERSTQTSQTLAVEITQTRECDEGADRPPPGEGA